MATLDEFSEAWLAARDESTRQRDRARLRDHVLPLLGRTRVRDLTAQHVEDVVRRTLAKKGMNGKSARFAYEVFAELLGAALGAGLLSQDPRVLPDGLWPVEPAVTRPSFSPPEIAALTSDARIDAELSIFSALGVYTGLPVRTLCSLRFSDAPGLPRAPFAEQLSRVLADWREVGFERVFSRTPNSDDWLVPRRSDVTQPHSEGSIFKAFRRACVAAGIKPRSLQALRTTFERALAESEGAPKGP
jgi:integrase